MLKGAFASFQCVADSKTPRMNPVGDILHNSDQAAESRAGRMFLSISCLSWAVLLFITASTIYVVGFRPLALVVKMTLALWVPYLLLTPLVWPMVRRFRISATRWRSSLPVHLLASVIFVVVCESCFVAVVGWLAPAVEAAYDAGPGRLPGHPPLPSNAGGGDSPVGFTSGSGLPRPNLRMAMIKAVANLPLYWVLSALAHALLASARLHEQEKRAAELNMHLARAQLSGLQTQIQPHFLFNTLNSISALIPRDARLANQMILNLSELLRMSLRDSDRQEVTLEEELQLLRHYVDIQQLRFGERLCFRLEHDEPSLRVRVPALLLQPLVENAIRHGVEPSEQPEEVLVQARTQGGILTLEVVNTCHAPVAERPSGAASTGLGLPNTAARLAALHGPLQTFHHQALTTGGYRVVLTLPAA